MLILGPLGIVSIVLAVAGSWKLLRPGAAQTAIRTLGVPLPTTAVRGIGGIELALGAATIVVGGAALAAAVAAAYVAFAAVAWRLRGSDVGCGCFGAASSTPPGALHIAVNLVAAGIAIIAAASGVPGQARAWDELPGLGVPHVLLMIVGATATLGLLTVLPDARAAVDGEIRRPQPVLFQPRRQTR
jgi:hypothetical protein